MQPKSNQQKIALLIVGLTVMAICAAIIFKNFSESKIPVCTNCNIIIITLETLRADHLPCYGYNKPTAPNICSYAKSNILFENAISQSSWTKPSIGSLFSSLYPHNHRFVKINSIFPDSIETMTEVLKRQGYFTMAFVANPFLRKIFNFHRGFNYWKMYRHTYKCTPDKGCETPRARELINDFLEALFDEGQRKFFAYLHLMDTHLPYNPPLEYAKKFSTDYTGQLDRRIFNQLKAVRNGSLNLNEADRQHIVSLYDAEISYIDDQLHFLIKQLKKRKLLEHTIVVIHSGHGEEFWDHGGFEHGHTMYNELLHVPLIIIHPGTGSVGYRISGTVRLIDVFPTLMGFLGLEAPQGIMGKNLSNNISSGKIDLNLAAFSEYTLYGNQKYSIQTNRWKLIDNENQNYEFYDLLHDPGETRKVQNIRIEQKLIDLLNAYRTVETKTKHTENVIKPDILILKQLKELGYIKE